MGGSARVTHNSKDLYNYLVGKELDFYPLTFENRDKWDSNPYSIGFDYTDNRNNNVKRFIKMLFEAIAHLGIDKSVINFESLLKSVYEGRLLSISEKEAKVLDDELLDFIQEYG